MNLSRLNEQVNRVFREAFGRFSNFTAIRAEQKDAPVPPDDIFASIKVQFSGDNGWDDRVYATKAAGVDLDETVTGLRTGFASINIFDKTNIFEEDNPVDIAEMFKSWLQSSDGVEFMQTSGVGVQNIGNPLDNTAIDEGQYEARATMTIDFNVSVERLSSVLEIQSVAVSGGVEVDGGISPVDLQISE